MRRMLFTLAALLWGCNAGLAQVSTMGSTAMGVPSTPGAIVSSPLNGPSPFSAATQPGAPDTTLTPVPLASDPTMPGTVVTCSTPTGQLAPGTPSVPVTSMSATSTTAQASSSASTTNNPPPPPPAPAVSLITTVSGWTVITAPAPPVVPPLPPPSIAPPSVPTPLTMTTSSTATTPATPLGTIPTPIVGSTTGTISPAPPLAAHPPLYAAPRRGARRPTAPLCRFRRRKFWRTRHSARFSPLLQSLAARASIRRRP